MNSTAEWTCFEVDLRAMSPIHIGWHKLGLVERTRYYITGRSVWGALVAGLARRLKPHGEPPSMYRECETTVCSDLRHTYFFPVRGGVVYRPRYAAGGLCYADKPARWLEKQLVRSQTSTALEASTLTAQDQALHESEFLSPFWPESDHVHFRGYVFLRRGGNGRLAEDMVRGTLRNIWVGADRKYGWGWLSEAGWKPATCVFGEFKILTGGGDSPLLSGPAGATLCSHARAVATNSMTITGELEVVSGRNWEFDGKKRGAGQGIEPATVCWAPGSQVREASVWAVANKGFWNPSNVGGG